jgi:NAD(P)-dependent dehydrogenase (short-subunit alcohol dehydrogenase family)
MSEITTPVGGKRILVTSGTTGISRETVALLAREGAQIVTFGRGPAALEDCLSNLGEHRSAVHGFTVVARVSARMDRCCSRPI